MAHIPTVDIRQLGDISFDRQLALAQQPNRDYDVDQWLFVPNTYTEYRYILGTRGEKPLICVGINPSTARPGALDPTLKSVERIARNSGFDSFIMFNVYAQRATSPDDMEHTCNPELHRENMRAFAYILSHTGSGGVGGLGDHHREAGLPVALPAGYDRPGRGRRRPVGHLRQALCGGASPSPPVPPGGRRAGALRRGGLRRCGGDPCCRCGPWPSPPGMRRGAL